MQLRAYLAFDAPARGGGEAVLKRRRVSSASLTPPSASFVHQQAPPSLTLLVDVMIRAPLLVLASGRGSLAAATPRRGRPAATLLLLPRHASRSSRAAGVTRGGSHFRESETFPLPLLAKNKQRLGFGKHALESATAFAAAEFNNKTSTGDNADQEGSA